MKPGSRWVYRETDTRGGEQRVVVTVTKRTKRIANGVTARVVRDVATEHGEVVEATDDWYAQDGDGNIWYLGEATAEYSNGTVVNRRGSFEVGVDGAQAGIAMPARPRPNMSYRQEYLKGVAEDSGAVVTVGAERVEVPFGHFSGVLMTRDLVPLEPRVEELKFSRAASVSCSACTPTATAAAASSSATRPAPADRASRSSHRPVLACAPWSPTKGTAQCPGR